MEKQSCSQLTDTEDEGKVARDSLSFQYFCGLNALPDAIKETKLRIARRSTCTAMELSFRSPHHVAASLIKILDLSTPTSEYI